MVYIEDLSTWRLEENSIELINAAANDDASRIRQLIDTGANLDALGPRGWTALRKAAANNSYEVAMLLLKRGAAVDATNYTGKTALMMACATGHHAMVSLLLFFSADPNRIDDQQRTPLMLGAMNGYPLVVGVLLDADPFINLDQTDRDGKTALQLALDRRHHDVSKMLAVASMQKAFRSHKTLV